ncbi:hemerythrin domain-containing protein [Pseudomonas sp. 273]|uniref:hemerythrin domain-containing protein n=1 Tax=Pseudomonas sp. 273 TaxID=75692 RepID=UPI0023D7E25D|nr:hemerythrin domain-containing protein [Pseudomonas sp. 273]
MNAIELLKQDHQVVKDLLAELSGTSERAVKTRENLLQRIELELKVHTSIEEQIFYPAFREAGSKSETKLYFEALEEHRAVEALVLPDLNDTAADSVRFAARVKVLQDLLEHHIQEEEEQMFEQALKLFSSAELSLLGAQMKELKGTLKSTYGAWAA